MKIKNINIKGFHCYEDTSFGFGKEVTILIGRNGTGKSSLLKAVRDSISFVFNNKKGEWGGKSLSNGVPDLGVANFSIGDIHHDLSLRTDNYLSIVAEAEYQDEVLPAWELRRTAQVNARVQPTLYKDAYISFMQEYARCGQLPVFAYYSDRYPHVESKLEGNVKSVVENDEDLNPNWGYYNWNKPSSSTYIWQRRYMNVYQQKRQWDDVIAEQKAMGVEVDENVYSNALFLQKELSYVVHYLRRFTDNSYSDVSDKDGLKKIATLAVGGIDEKFLRLLYMDGSLAYWNELPAGYERLFSIVFDIAYRFYILNRLSIDPFGVVIIDELDLHLHPSLEQDVIQRLRHTFPFVQFIIATHSPLVISNFKQNENNIVIKMDKQGDAFIHSVMPNVFGMDYDFTISSVMDTSPQHAPLQSMMDRYIRLIRRNKLELAEETLNQVKEYVGSEQRFLEIKNQLETAAEEE